MRAFDFWVMMLCCLCWGGNFVMTSWALGSSSVQPFMLASARAMLVLAVMGIFPLPAPAKTILEIALRLFLRRAAASGLSLYGLADSASLRRVHYFPSDDPDGDFAFGYLAPGENRVAAQCSQSPARSSA